MLLLIGRLMGCFVCLWILNMVFCRWLSILLCLDIGMLCMCLDFVGCGLMCVVLILFCVCVRIMVFVLCV